MAGPILTISDLHVRFGTPDGEVHAVQGIEMEVAAGETVAVVGESGSGKSQIMMAVMGLLASNGRATGSVDYRGQQLLGLPPKKLNQFRGDKLSMIFQEPMTSLDPLFTIEKQVGDLLVFHQGVSRSEARPRVLELLRLVGIPKPESRLKAYPHELSGGQRQRVMIAMALANEPDILIADEPTTALDVTIQAQILELLADLQQRFGMAILFITHDLGIVRRIADRVYVMQKGRIEETGPTREIFERPKTDYTRMLLAAEPEGKKPPVAESEPILLEGHQVRVVFPLESGWFGRNKSELVAVDGIDLRLQRGQTLGVVGESGSGKSTLGRALLRLVSAAGHITYQDRDLARLDKAELQPLRKELQVVFQDPFGSLSPRLTVGQIVGEGLLVHAPELSRKEREREVARAMASVQLEPAWSRRYPHEFSGGQRQRIAIARAIILKPAFVLLDEPTSALDRTVQKQIVELLRDLQSTYGLTYLFISHDLAVVRAMADTVMVMKDGQVVEAGLSDDIFDRPREDYTKALMAAAFGQQPAHTEALSA